MDEEESKQAIDLIYPTIELTSIEMVELARIFTAPIVQKYLLFLARRTNKELATVGSIELEDKKIADVHRTCLGRLEVLNTLLSIEYKQIKEN